MAILTPKTGSIIDGINGRDRTGTSLSTSIVIKVGSTPVGAIQSINITETRPLVMIDELGTDGHIDSTPKAATDIAGTCTRIRYDRLRMSEAFSRGYLHVSSQRIPFDIDIYDTSNGDGSSAIITTVRNVWIASIGYQLEAGNFIITDTMSFQAESIYSTLNGGNAAVGGERGSNILQINSIERQTDVGQRRGALDAPGLITDYFSNI
jgi:hypothetical protein